MAEERKMHYVKIFYQRLLTSTRGWKDDEFGAYVRLLLEQFDNGFIPDDPAEITRLITTYRKNWPRISKKFKLAETGRLKNDFMEEIRKEAHDISSVNSENGKKGGRPKTKRSDKHTESEIKPNGYDSLNRNESHTNGLLVNGYYPGFQKGGEGEKLPIVQALFNCWIFLKPEYPADRETDFPALLEIGEFISRQVSANWLPQNDDDHIRIKDEWITLVRWIVQDSFYKSFSLSNLSKIKTLQTILQKQKQDGTALFPGGGQAGKPGTSEARLDAAASW